MLKLIFIGIGLLFFLIIPFQVVNAQFKITTSEGVKVIGNQEAFEKSSSETKGETWIRKYELGEQEKEYQQVKELKAKEQEVTKSRQDYRSTGRKVSSRCSGRCR